jgi:hypothetical protein
LKPPIEGRDSAGFYRHLGYHTDDVVSMGKRLIDDAALQRSPNSTPARRADPKGAPNTRIWTAAPLPKSSR